MCTYVRYGIESADDGTISTVFGEFMDYQVEGVSAEQASSLIALSLPPLGDE